MLQKASAGAQQFLATYRTFLLSTARQRLDDAAAAQARALAAGEHAASSAVTAEMAAREAAAAAAALATAEQLEREEGERVQGILASDAYKHHKDLEDRRRARCRRTPSRRA